MVITRMSSSRQNWQAEIMSYLKNLSFQECHSCWNARFKQHIGLAGVGVMSQRGGNKTSRVEMPSQNKIDFIKNLLYLGLIFLFDYDLLSNKGPTF